MKTYELLYIISPTIIDQDIDQVVEQVNNHITTMGAVLSKVENLGRRQLTYEIKHHREGTYILVQFQSHHGQEIPELERRLRVMDSILRYLTVNLDPDLRRIDRMKRKRTSRKETRVKASVAGGRAQADGVSQEEEEISGVEEEE